MFWLPLVHAEPVSEELQRRVDLDQAARSGEGDAAAVDADNQAWLVEHLDQHGWPVEGPFDSQNAWILCQHAPLPLLRRCVTLMEPLVGQGVDPKHQALLADTAAVLAGEPQLYGSRVRPDPVRGAIRPCPIVDAEQVDARRAALGWAPLATYVQAFDGHAGLPASAEPWSSCPVPGSTVVGSGFVEADGVFDVDQPIEGQPPYRTEADYDEDGRLVAFRLYVAGELVQELSYR